VSDLASELGRRLREAKPDAAAIRARLDAATHAERVAAVRGLRRAEQRSLYRSVRGFLPLGLADLVPAEIADGVTVCHHGVNSLPLFTHFEKRLCRPAGEDRGKPLRLYGFNFQRLAPLTGPGYFVAFEDPAAAEVRIDYTQRPEEVPEGWPALRSNERGLARLVYGFMVDTLRRVSEHVTVGSAARHGRDVDSWFVLVRED